MVTRRQLFRTVGSAGIVGTLAGCAGDEPTEGEEPTETATPSPTPTSSPTPTETAAPVVDVGPEKRLRFDPEEIEVSVGETIEWVARSVGHNVTSHPGASPKCENPEGAEPFASYEGDSHFAIMDVGERFTHEFTVPGEYVYVCAPHAGQGMVATVIVSE